MKAITVLLSCVLLSGCAGLRSNMKRHPVIYGVAAGAVVGVVVISLAPPQGCPHSYDGKPYDGTPPCPK